MSLGDHTQVRTKEIELVPVFMFSKQRHRRKFTVVFVLVVKKSALDVQNLLFFSFTYWAHCSRRHCRPRRCSQDLSMCVNGWESEHGFSKNACHHFKSHNFWSKLYFYMKFLKYVSYSIEYLWSEVQLSASSLCFFLSHSVAVAVLSEMSHVACRAPDDSFWAFLSPSMQESLRLPNNIMF